MVRAELEYNPYLLETKVRFNGNSPRINCMVEKYQNEKLQTWVSKIPGIFYDEMNGYDFELDFTGTELDFEEIKKSFIQADVGKDKVLLFHKGELDSRAAKVQAIDNLLRWLDETPNRRFDVVSFRENNEELFEGAYPLVIVGGSVNEERVFTDVDISVESVSSVDELKKTNLRSTPVLLCIDRKTIGSLQYSLKVLLNRADVEQDQLFFFISPVLGSKVERVLVDLGVKAPKIVETVSDEEIHRFLEIYPITEYIQDAIQVFREQTETIGTILEEENQKSKIKNQDIHEKIENLEDILSRLKASLSSFENRENLKYPEELSKVKSDLISAIGRWKNKKVKITKIDEAEALSAEYDLEIERKFERYKQEVLRIYRTKLSAISNQCRDWYTTAHYNEECYIDDVYPPAITEYGVPEIAPELMNLKEEQYVTPKEDFLGKLLRTSQDNAAQGKVLETTFFCEKWRSYAVSIVDKITEKMNQEIFDSLCRYYDEVSKKYNDCLENLIQEISSEKDQVSSHLSEEERILQADNDWHISFCDMLHEIERA